MLQWCAITTIEILAVLFFLSHAENGFYVHKIRMRYRNSNVSLQQVSKGSNKFKNYSSPVKWIVLLRLSRFWQLKSRWKIIVKLFLIKSQTFQVRVASTQMWNKFLVINRRALSWIIFYTNFILGFYLILPRIKGPYSKCHGQCLYSLMSEALKKLALPWALSSSLNNEEVLR